MANASAHIQWGDVGTWVGGIATAIALFLTYALLVITRREQKAQRTEHREAQARLVAAWCDHIEETTNGSAHAVTVMLQNLSDEPIYGARAAVGPIWSTKAVDYKEVELKYVIPPKSHQQQTVSLAIGLTAAGDRETSPPVELIFSDAAHRFWYRNRNGRLVEIPKERLPVSANKYFFRATNIS
jgi:hypothetical protein